MTPFSYLFYSSVATEIATDGVVEVMATLAGAAVLLFAFYKLGTVETVIKLVATIVLVVGVLYGVGFFYPPFQEAAWYQLLKWIVEVGPRLVLDQIGGTTS